MFSVRADLTLQGCLRPLALGSPTLVPRSPGHKGEFSSDSQPSGVPGDGAVALSGEQHWPPGVGPWQVYLVHPAVTVTPVLTPFTEPIEVPWAPGPGSSLLTRTLPPGS